MKPKNPLHLLLRPEFEFIFGEEQNDKCIIFFLNSFFSYLTVIYLLYNWTERKDVHTSNKNAVSRWWCCCVRYAFTDVNTAGSSDDWSGLMCVRVRVIVTIAYECGSSEIDRLDVKWMNECGSGWWLYGEDKIFNFFSFMKITKTNLKFK